MARPRIGEQPLTPVQRQQRRRDKLRQQRQAQLEQEQRQRDRNADRREARSAAQERREVEELAISRALRTNGSPADIAREIAWGDLGRAKAIVAELQARIDARETEGVKRTNPSSASIH